MRAQAEVAATEFGRFAVLRSMRVELPVGLPEASPGANGGAYRGALSRRRATKVADDGRVVEERWCRC